ncbi:MAG: phospho-N-acetylmuramoyl-pentapeptide-transferase [Actinomycetota bacterium]|nr:phospho-N-acetylmuramoyl-pentapeptide-transferase [Actinomycetota bacterium]
MLGVLSAGCLAFLLCLVGTAWLIGVLRSYGIGQPIHEAVTQHAAKAGTPTMGGIALSVVTPIAYLVGATVSGTRIAGGGLTLLAATVAGGLVGAADDWLKVKRGRNTLGLRERQKSVLLVVVAVLAVTTSGSSACHAPSLARCEPLPDIGLWPWAVWVLAVVWLTTNSVNFTDGADGLLAGCSVAPLTLLAGIAYWEHRHPADYPVHDALPIAIILAALAAGCLGLLWWSAAPAKVHMGDTGSLAIGAAIAVAAIKLDVELLIPVFGAVFVAEGLSSFAQRVWFKTTRRLRRDRQPQRLFRMAPLHHHFELLGWPETHIVFRFWILSTLASGLAGAIFYADAVNR